MLLHGLLGQTVAAICSDFEQNILTWGCNAAGSDGTLTSTQSLDFSYVNLTFKHLYHMNLFDRPCNPRLEGNGDEGSQYYQ